MFFLPVVYTVNSLPMLTHLQILPPDKNHESDISCMKQLIFFYIKNRRMVIFSHEFLLLLRFSKSWQHIERNAIVPSIIILTIRGRF